MTLTLASRAGAADGHLRETNIEQFPGLNSLTAVLLLDSLCAARASGPAVDVSLIKPSKAPLPSKFDRSRNPQQVALDVGYRLARTHEFTIEVRETELCLHDCQPELLTQFREVLQRASTGVRRWRLWAASFVAMFVHIPAALLLVANWCSMELLMIDALTFELLEAPAALLASVSSIAPIHLLWQAGRRVTGMSAA